jgi:hypothetical protein
MTAGKNGGEFTKHKDRTAKELVAYSVASCILFIQKQWSVGMSNICSLLGRRTMYTLLVFFIIGGVIGSLYIFLSKHVDILTKTQYSRSIIAPVIGRKLYLTDRERIVMKAAYLKVVLAKHYLDSLNASDSGKVELDLWLKVRPGFIDSLNLAESFLRERLSYLDSARKE